MSAARDTPKTLLSKPLFPQPVSRLGDSLDGPGDPNNVFLIFRESAILEYLDRDLAHMRSLEDAIGSSQ